jgi:hypothetical protein
LQDDIKFLLSLIPDSYREVPKDLPPMFYHTLSYEGDLRIRDKLKEIENKYG